MAPKKRTSLSDKPLVKKSDLPHCLKHHGTKSIWPPIYCHSISGNEKCFLLVSWGCSKLESGRIWKCLSRILWRFHWKQYCMDLMKICHKTMISCGTCTQSNIFLQLSNRLTDVLASCICDRVIDPPETIFDLSLVLM